jgi:hypothetical protein
MNTRTIGLLAVLIISLAAPAGQAATEDAIRQLEQDIPSLYLLNGLFLSPEQCDALASILEEAAECEQEAREAITRLEKRYADDFDRAIQRTAREREQRGGRDLRTAMQSVRNVQETKHKTLEMLAEEAYMILTPAQQDIVDTFEPCFIPARDFREPVRVGQAAQDLTFGIRILERLRTVPASRLPEARERALERLVPFVMHKRHTKYSPEAEEEAHEEIAERLDEVLEELRPLNEADFELEKNRLAQHMLPIDQAEEPAAPHPYGGLKTGNHETMWKLRQYIVNPGCLDIVQARGSDSAVRPVQAVALSDTPDWSQQRDKLRVSRLLLPLQIVPRQAEELVPVVKDAVKARRALEKEAARLHAEAIEAYMDLREELNAQAPTEKTEQRANQLHLRLKEMREQDIVETLRPFEEKIDTILSACQVACLAHTGPEERRKLQDFVRGIAEERQMALRLLDEAREMNSVEFEQKKKDMAETFVRGCMARDRSQPPINRGYETGRARQTLEQARMMSRSRYREQREDLAAAMCPRRAQPRDVEYGRKYDRGEPMPILEVSSDLLFTDAALDALTAMMDR